MRLSLGLGIWHRPAQHRIVHQGLAAEEADVDPLALPRLAKQQVDTLPRRLVSHELGLRAVGGIDDLVFAILVAVATTQVALVRDVEDRRREGKRLDRGQRNDGRHLRHRFGGGPDRVDLLELGQEGIEVHRRKLRRHAGNQLGAVDRLVTQRVDQGARRGIQRKDSRAGDQIQIPLVGGLERMVFSEAKYGHGRSTAVGSQRR